MRFAAPARILAVAALLTLSLIALVVHEGMARAAGQEVKLAIGGFDPRSLLSGNYVEFNFVDELPAGQRCPPDAKALPPNWIALRLSGGRHVPVAAADTRAAALKVGEVAVRGRFNCREPYTPEPGEIGRASPAQVSLDLGLHRFHTSQAQALEIERAMTKPGGAFVLVSVGDDGKARLTGMEVGSRRIRLDWF